MTMHLMPVYYNNLNSKKRKKPFRKAGWQKAQAEHDKLAQSILITDDKNGNLWKSNPDKCCRIRKVLPLEKKLNPSLAVKLFFLIIIQT